MTRNIISLSNSAYDAAFQLQPTLQPHTHVTMTRLTPSTRMYKLEVWNRAQHRRH